MSNFLSEVRKHFDSFTSSQRTPVKDLLTLLGFGLISLQTLSILKGIAKTFVLPERDLASRYGKGSWALITGGTEGSGKHFSIELAKRGFNILILARSEEKFKAMEQEVRKANPNVDVQFFSIDFSKCQNLSFWDPLMERVKDLDVSIIINNAAIRGGRRFLSYPDEELFRSYNCNCLAPAMLVRKLLPKLLARPQRGAIINLGSMGGLIPLPLYITYGTTKYFLNFFSRCLSRDYGHKLDVQLLAPGIFDGNMTVEFKQEFFNIYSENVVKSSLGQLGYETSTAGHWRHKLQRFINESLPESWVVKGAFKRADERIKKTEIRLAKEAEMNKLIESKMAGTATSD